MSQWSDEQKRAAAEGRPTLIYHSNGLGSEPFLAIGHEHVGMTEYLRRLEARLAALETASDEEQSRP